MNQAKRSLNKFNSSERVDDGEPTSRSKRRKITSEDPEEQITTTSPTSIAKPSSVRERLAHSSAFVYRLGQKVPKRPPKGESEGVSRGSSSDWKFRRISRDKGEYGEDVKNREDSKASLKVYREKSETVKRTTSTDRREPLSVQNTADLRLSSAAVRVGKNSEVHGTREAGKDDRHKRSNMSASNRAGDEEPDVLKTIRECGFRDDTPRQKQRTSFRIPKLSRRSSADSNPSTNKDSQQVSRRASADVRRTRGDGRTLQSSQTSTNKPVKKELYSDETIPRMVSRRCSQLSSSTSDDDMVGDDVCGGPSQSMPEGGSCGPGVNGYGKETAWRRLPGELRSPTLKRKNPDKLSSGVKQSTTRSSSSKEFYSSPSPPPFKTSLLRSLSTSPISSGPDSPELFNPPDVTPLKSGSPITTPVAPAPHVGTVSDSSTVSSPPVSGDHIPLPSSPHLDGTLTPLSPLGGAFPPSSPPLDDPPPSSSPLNEIPLSSPPLDKISLLSPPLDRTHPPSSPPLDGLPPSSSPPLDGTPPHSSPPLDGTPPPLSSPLDGTPPPSSPPLDGTPPSSSPPLDRTLPTPSPPLDGIPPSSLPDISPPALELDGCHHRNMNGERCCKEVLEGRRLCQTHHIEAIKLQAALGLVAGISGPPATRTPPPPPAPYPGHNPPSSSPKLDGNPPSSSPLAATPHLSDSSVEKKEIVYLEIDSCSFPPKGETPVNLISSPILPAPSRQGLLPVSMHSAPGEDVTNQVNGTSGQQPSKVDLLDVSLKSREVSPSVTVRRGADGAPTNQYSLPREDALRQVGGSDGQTPSEIDILNHQEQHLMSRLVDLRKSKLEVEQEMDVLRERHNNLLFQIQQVTEEWEEALRQKKQLILGEHPQPPCTTSGPETQDAHTTVSHPPTALSPPLHGNESLLTPSSNVNKLVPLPIHPPKQAKPMGRVFHPQHKSRVCFTKFVDGYLVSASKDGICHFYNTLTGMFSFSYQTGLTDLAAFDVTNRLLAGASYSGHVYIFHWNTLNPIPLYTKALACVLSLKCVGACLAVGLIDGRVQVFDTKTGILQYTVRCFIAPSGSSICSLEANLKYFVVGSSDQVRPIICWQIEDFFSKNGCAPNYQSNFSIPFQSDKAWISISTMHLTTDNILFTGFSDGSLRMHDLVKRVTLKSIKVSTLPLITISYTHHLLFTSSQHEDLQVWNLNVWMLHGIVKLPSTVSHLSTHSNKLYYGLEGGQAGEMILQLT